MRHTLSGAEPGRNVRYKSAVAPVLQDSKSLTMPLYGASPREAVSRFFLKYATFSGRASRAEHWWWFLVAALVPVAIQITYGLMTQDWRQPQHGLSATLTQLFSLAVFIPSLALTWRRLHDINRSGLWFFFGLIPILGWIFLLIFTVTAADPRGTRFDRAPTHRTDLN